MDKVVGKIIVLREICENKNILFGPFSENITLQRKVDIWNKILAKGKSLGLLSYDKDYKYMRDVFWQNLKRSALGKKKGKLKSGREKKYSPIDDLVFEILKKSNTPVPPMTEAVETVTKKENEDSLDFALLETTQQAAEEGNEDSNIVYVDGPEDSPASPVYRKKSRLKKKKFMSEEKMKRRKMALQVEYMELQNYKMKLEVYEMEQKLGLSHSEYTKDVVRNKNGNATNGHNIMFQEIDSNCESDDSS